MNRAVVLQVRMGSSRLPGKAMLPLAGEPALVHEVRRAARADSVETPDVVVATSRKPQDDIVAVTADRVGATVYRGSEADVIGRVHEAVESVGADAAVRLCGDNTLIDPQLVDVLFEHLSRGPVDYVSTKFERTFPVGHNADAFTAGTIADAAAAAEDDYHREHVAQYFKANVEEIERANVTADEVFERSVRESVSDLTDLRLTMDEAPDYELLRQVYDTLADEHGFVETPEAIQYIENNDLRAVNAGVQQEVW
jgi:spore coat polysaccharide biosynthesis protein SpsF